MKTYEQPQFNVVNVTIVPKSGSPASYIDAGAHLLSQLAHWLDEGFYGSLLITNVSFNAVLLAPNKDEDEVSALTTSALLSVSKLDVSVMVTLVTGNQVLNGSYGYLPAGLQVAPGSRLLSKSAVSDETAMRRILADLLPKGIILQPFAVRVGQVARNKDLDMGLNPAWREAYVHFLIETYVTEPASRHLRTHCRKSGSWRTNTSLRSRFAMRRTLMRYIAVAIE